MSHKKNLRGLRALWCLSQNELANLLGVNQARISRYEKNEEVPALSTALALQVVFAFGPKTIFHDTYDIVEDAVMRRAAEFERTIGAGDDYATKRKRHLLDAMIARATSRTDA